MNGLALLLGATVIFIAAYIVYRFLVSQEMGCRSFQTNPSLYAKDGIDYLPDKTCCTSVTISHPLRVPARLSAQFPLQSSDGFQFLCGLLSEVYSSAVFTTMVQWWHLFAIRAKVLVVIIESNVGRRAKLLFAILRG